MVQWLRAFAALEELELVPVTPSAPSVTAVPGSLTLSSVPFGHWTHMDMHAAKTLKYIK